MNRPLRRFDPFRPIDMLTSLWSAAAVAPVSSGAAAAYRTLFTTVRRLVVGRRLAMRLDDGELTLTVTEFDSKLDVRGLSVGQLNDVRIAASDIRWEDKHFDRTTVMLHNVHIRPTAPPMLVAAPVELTVDVPAAALDDLFRWAAPRLSGQVGGDGIARLRLARRPMLGHIEVDARLDGSTLWLQAAWTRRRPIALDPARADTGLSCATSGVAPRPAADRYHFRPRRGVPYCGCVGMADGYTAQAAGGHPRSAQRRRSATEPDPVDSASLSEQFASSSTFLIEVLDFCQPTTNFCHRN